MARPLVSIPLSVPIEHNGEPIATLTLRQPRPDELPGLRRLKSRDPDRIMGAVVRLTGLPRSVVGEIDMLDLAALNDRLADFLKAPR